MFNQMSIGYVDCPFLSFLFDVVWKKNVSEAREASQGKKEVVVDVDDIYCHSCYVGLWQLQN